MTNVKNTVKKVVAFIAIGLTIFGVGVAITKFISKKGDYESLKPNDLEL